MLVFLCFFSILLLHSLFCLLGRYISSWRMDHYSSLLPAMLQMKSILHTVRSSFTVQSEGVHDQIQCMDKSLSLSFSPLSYCQIPHKLLEDGPVLIRPALLCCIWSPSPTLYIAHSFSTRKQGFCVSMFSKKCNLSSLPLLLCCSHVAEEGWSVVVEVALSNTSPWL